MALINCRDCNSPIASDAKSCVRCGSQSPTLEAKIWGAGKSLFGLLFWLAVVGAILFVAV